MILLIHDLKDVSEEELKKKFAVNEEEVKVVSDNGTIKPCCGCFGCWVKTPGVCVIKDAYQDLGSWMGKADKLIIISECRYGTYSPFIKNVLDRSISYVHPNFTKRNKEMHHKKRYDNRALTKVYFYGEFDEEEKNTARKLVDANVLNFNGITDTVDFFSSKEEVLR